MRRLFIFLLIHVALLIISDTSASASEANAQSETVAIGNVEVGGLSDSEAAKTKSMLQYVLWAALRGQGFDVNLNKFDGSADASSDYTIDMNYFQLGNSFVADMRLTRSESGIIVKTATKQGAVAQLLSSLEVMSGDLVAALAEVLVNQTSVAFGPFGFVRKGGPIKLRPSKVSGDIRKDICTGDLSIAIYRAVTELDEINVLEPVTSEINCKSKAPPTQIASDRNAGLVVTGTVTDERQGVRTSVSIISGESLGELTINYMLSEPSDYDAYRQSLSRRVKGYVEGIRLAWNDRSEIFDSFANSNGSELADRGFTYWENGNQNLAVAFFQEAISQDSELARAHNALAKLYYELSEIYSFEEMLDVAQHAVSLDPDNIDYRWDVANALTLLARYDEALDEIDRIDVPSASKDWHASMEFNRAQIFVYRGDYEAARKAYLSAFKNDPSRVNAVTAVVDLYTIDGAYSKAIDVLQSALEVRPEEQVFLEKLPQVYLEFGQYLLSAGDYRQAGEMFRASLKLDPQNANAYMGIMYIEFEVNHEFEAAYEAAAKAIEIDQQTGGVESEYMLQNAAEATLASGRTEEAVQYASQALDQTESAAVKSAMHFVRTIAAMIEKDSEQLRIVLDELFETASKLDADPLIRASLWSYSGTEAFIKENRDLQWQNQEFLLSIAKYLKGEISFDELKKRREIWQSLS
jgi:tetratricopeptide (TPR) repeat protein